MKKYSATALQAPFHQYCSLSPPVAKNLWYVRSESCGILCATTAHESFGDRILRGFSSGLVSLDTGFFDCKGKTKEICLLSHHIRRHRFTNSAMSDDGAQMAREKSRMTAASTRILVCMSSARCLLARPFSTLEPSL